MNAKSEDASNEAKQKDMLMKISALRGKLNGLTKNIVYEKNPQKKKELNKQLAEYQKELRKATMLFSKLEKLRNK